MNDLRLIQMHGDPGTGKSTFARALGAALPAIVLDKDILQSAVLRTGGDEALAAPAAYETLFGLAESILAQRYSVILDTPCAWPSIEERGRAMAATAGATWTMIETVCPDSVIDHRLARRVGLESQPTVRQHMYARPGTRRPTCEHLTLDTTHPLASLLAGALAYLGTRDSGLGTHLSTQYSVLAPPSVLSPQSSALAQP